MSGDTAASLRAFFDRAKAEGKRVLGYGASTKAMWCCQYCGVSSADMPAIAEKYPFKFGLVTPGTRIPIISEEQAKAMARLSAGAALVFRDEIVQREQTYIEAAARLCSCCRRSTVGKKGMNARDTVLITGALGQDGSLLTEYLLGLGHEVIGVVREPTDASLGAPVGARLMRADLSDEAARGRC